MIGNIVAAQVGVPSGGGGNAPVAGSALWLDASDASTFTFSSGTRVSQWNDKSGNSRNFSQSSTGAQRALDSNVQNGLSAVAFGSGSVQWLSRSSFNWAGSAFTVFLVTKTTTGGNYQNIFASDTLYGTSLAIDVSNAYSVFNIGAAAYASNLSYTSGNADVTSWKSAGQSAGSIAVYLRKNQVAASSVINAGYTNTSSNAALGAGNSGERYYGYVCEVLVYQSQLSAGDITSNETYLKNKWGTP